MSDEEPTSVTDKWTQILDFNSAIVGFTREKIVEVQALAALHREVAVTYDSIAEQLAEAAATSAKLIGDAIVAEMGLGGDAEEEEEEDEDDG